MVLRQIHEKKRYVLTLKLSFHGLDNVFLQLLYLFFQPQLPKGGRIVSNQSEAAWNTSRVQTPVNSSTTYTAPEQTYVYGGYGDGSINWGENSNNAYANNMHIMSPVRFSLLLEKAYSF